MVAPERISKIGIGTWGIGGFAEADPNNNDAADIAGLQRWFIRGANYIEVPLWYADGRTAELVATAIHHMSMARRDLFIVMTVYSYGLTGVQDIAGEFGRFKALFNTDYADAIQLAMPSVLEWGEEATWQEVERMLQAGQVRYLNLTNANLEFLQRAHQRFGDTLFAHEIHLNFEIRINDDLGISQYADQNHIRNVIAQPIRRNRTAARKWPLLVELAAAYGATQNQIILAWLVARGMLPIPKAVTPDHVDELLGALSFTLKPEDIQRINEWRPPGYTSPPIDWRRTLDPTNGVAIDQLANVFDNTYKA